MPTCHLMAVGTPAGQPGLFSPSFSCLLTPEDLLPPGPPTPAVDWIQLIGLLIHSVIFLLSERPL